ncbi:MAG TPA: endolytic transglycosylase MltG [Pseudoclavibacter sp.]|nr:endolytic transglycosylase MltG [Pseudoclavibacter sp.]
MTEEPFRGSSEDPFEDTFGGLASHDDEDPQGEVLSRRELRERSGRRGRSRRRKGRAIAILLVAVVVLAGLGAGVAVLLNGPFNYLIAMNESTDYEGDGEGETTIVIESGDYGSQVADTLEEAGVIKDASSFYKYLLALTEEPTFQPGTYRMRLKMSNQAALAALEDDSNRVTRSVTIPEGYTVNQIFAALEEVGFSADELSTLRADPQQFGLPDAAIDLEGYLFPATYDFDDSTTAEQAIQTMVDRMEQSLNDLGISMADSLDTIVLASIIQKEAGSNVTDMAKISRVFLNRIDQGMLLQSDATVAYGAGSQGTVWTTSSQRADESNQFNTYVYEGLPPGAISNPGDDALSAAVNPADGDWLYFTVVNLSTGETVFSETDDEHSAAVEQLQQWCAESDENAAYCG